MLYPLSYEGLECERTVHAGVGPKDATRRG